MVNDLVQRGMRICERLTGENIGIPLTFREGLASTHIHFFTKLVESLEGTGAAVDGLVENECRELLSVAGSRIFSNLWLLRETGVRCRDTLKLDAVLKTVEPKMEELADALPQATDGYVDDLLDLLLRVDAGDDGSGGSSSAGSGGVSAGDPEEQPLECLLLCA